MVHRALVHPSCKTITKTRLRRSLGAIRTRDFSVKGKKYNAPQHTKPACVVLIHRLVTSSVVMSYMEELSSPLYFKSL